MKTSIVKPGTSPTPTARGDDDIARGKVRGMRGLGPDTQHVDVAQDGNDPDIPSADELFCDEAFQRLRCSKEIGALVERLRAREQDIARRAELAGRDALLRAYGEFIAADLSAVGVALSSAHGSAADLFDAVASLPFTPKSAPTRRRAREIARVAMLYDEGSLRVPACADDLHALWEQAMLREPRWSADYPTSDFRTGDVEVVGARPERKVVHRCMPADEVPVWLDRLIDLLADERLAPEVRAACGLCLQDWIHPFYDGNGHTGRLLMIAVLECRYSQPTLVCLARELVVNHSTTMRLFRLLRDRESDVVGFCAGLLGQLGDAQESALGMLG